MNDIHSCALAFEKLLDIEYQFVIAKKGKLFSFTLGFDKKTCYHLMGLQHLKDVDALGGDRQKVFDRILNGKIGQDMLMGSAYYEQIADRVRYLGFLEKMLDSNETVFKYHKKFNKYSRIEAEFLLSNKMVGQELYLFIDRDDGERYFCRSFFPRAGRDYTANQPRYTLLYKEKIYLKTGRSCMLYDRSLSRA